MRATNRQVSDTLKKVRMSYPELQLKYKVRGKLGTFDREKLNYPKIDNHEPDVWRWRTEKHANADEKELALWTLCVYTCLLFKQELRNRNARLDIIEQLEHQFEAYGRKD